MFPTREHRNEALPHALKSGFGLRGRERRDGWLSPDQSFELGDEAHDELAVAAQRLADLLSPAAHLRVALRQDLTNQTLERLRDRRVRNTPPILIELACREQPARRHEGLVELTHDGALADPRVAGHEHQLRRAFSDDPVEGREEQADLGFASIELLGNDQPVGLVASPESEGRDSSRAIE